MREFDFDELDKAVSSLMNKNQKNTADQPSDDTSTDQPTPTSTPNETAELSSPEPSAAQQSETTPVADEASDSPAEDNLSEDSPSEKSDDSPASGSRSVPHRAGSFMDVKHDSSKMRSSSQTAGRHGITIEPTGSSLSDKPDEASKSEADDLQDEIAKIDETETLEMAASPFLSDAKVEKRPLGRPGSAFKPNKSDDEQPEVATTDTDTADEAEEAASVNAEEPVGLPEELQPDLISIESDVDTEATAETEPDATAETTGEPKVDLTKELEPSQTEPAKPEPETDSKPTGPVSIPQQYKESPSSQPQDSGTIYDTENYHQPIKHPVKKKSGWMIVVWIVLIIILGCALGAAAYFSGMI
ncbi:MAG: hypothetical protein L0H38_02035 [bacterium]|nr:hypothetical protein [bacterium]